MYIARHSPRKIPVGYSAADDLRYRTSLAHFLECGDEYSSVDFYGVNSYQWCGHQTFGSSGYDTLVFDYRDYSLPIFMSEYGCNAVYPRLFQEVTALYTPLMTSVFSGGLVYEFTQEPNNYGLVELDQSGNAYTISDFDTLKGKLDQIGQVEAVTPKEFSRPLVCRESYENLNTQIPIPNSFGTDMITNGLPVRRGTYVNVAINATMHKIYDTNGLEMIEKTIQIVQPLTAIRIQTEEIVEEKNIINNNNNAIGNILPYSPIIKSNTAANTTPESEFATISENTVQPTVPSTISRRSKEEKLKNLEHKKLNGGKESSSAYPTAATSGRPKEDGQKVSSGGEKMTNNLFLFIFVMIILLWTGYELF